MSSTKTLNIYLTKKISYAKFMQHSVICSKWQGRNLACTDPARELTQQKKPTMKLHFQDREISYMTSENVLLILIYELTQTTSSDDCLSLLSFGFVAFFEF